MLDSSEDDCSSLSHGELLSTVFRDAIQHHAERQVEIESIETEEDINEKVGFRIKKILDLVILHLVTPQQSICMS